MDSYRRPSIEPVEFRDADGVVIEYGDRWGAGSPPEESYSVLSNVERFRPLHRIGQALIDALVTEYAVTVEDDPALAELMHDRDDVIRAVKVTPRDPAAASLTFVFTSFPSVIVHAGVLHDFRYPVCGCDACDENWQRMAEELEWCVGTVVDGGYRESVDPHGVGFRLADESGSRSGSARSEDFPRARLDAAVRTLSTLEGWKAWPSTR